MKATEQFTRTIAEYLNLRAATDTLFAPNLQKPHKSIEQCITYILNQVQKSGCNGFDDDEIYSMAIHYYDEDDLEVGNSITCNVVVNHVVELTEEEKAEARRLTWLIDVLYDFRVKLCATSAVDVNHIYTEGDFAEEFTRTASRMVEMQSEVYLEQPHLTLSPKD